MAPLCPFTSQGVSCPLKKYLLVIYDTSSIKCLKCVKNYGKHFIDPKSSEMLSIFQVFACTMQIALFWQKLLPALFEALISLPF
jgi:hypothetical protein